MANIDTTKQEVKLLWNIQLWANKGIKEIKETGFRSEQTTKAIAHYNNQLIEIYKNKNNNN